MKKKSNTGVIIAACVAYAIVFAGAVSAAVVFMGGRFFKSPEVKLKAGFANMIIELASYDSTLTEKIDFASIQALGDTKTMHTDTDVSVTMPESEIGNMSFHIDALTNKSAKTAACDIGVGVYGFEVSFADIAAEENMLYISLPMFLKDTYSVELTNLGENFNNSEWAKLFDAKLPEDYSITLFEDREDKDDEGQTGDWSGFYQTLTENVRYQNIEEKKDGYAGVRVLLEQDAANQCVQALAEDMRANASYEMYQNRPDIQSAEELDEAIDALESMRFATDCMLDFYLDDKGRIAIITTPADIETENGGAISVDIRFFGEERMLDVITGDVYMKDGGGIYHLYFQRSADVSDERYSEEFEILLQADSYDDDMIFTYQNVFDKEDLAFDMEIYAKTSEGNLRLDADGEFTDIVKGEGYTFRINNAALSIDDEELGYVSVVSTIEPSAEEPEIPDSAKDLLAMDTSEIQQLVYEAFASLRTLEYD